MCVCVSVPGGVWPASFRVYDELLLVGTGHFDLDELRLVEFGLLAKVQRRVHLAAQIASSQKASVSFSTQIRIRINRAAGNTRITSPF